MCGIAGFTFERGRQSSEHQIILNKMLTKITHRGPDQQGTKLVDTLALGHNRLTIMEPNGGRQPRIHTDNGNMLSYNGEIYNHQIFFDEIISAGKKLRDLCDTETLFWLIEIYGIKEALHKLDGMFAFAYYDHNQETLYLARDRLGQKPLYYTLVNGQLIFASEIKSLREHPSLANIKPDYDTLKLYLVMEYVAGPATGINGIYELPPGHILRYKDNKIQVDCYWNIQNYARKQVIDKNLAKQALDQALNQAVEQQLVADVPVGIFLSGGLDSSLIAAIARRHRSDVATFTVRFPQSSFDESVHAERVAKKLGTRHTTIEINLQNSVDGLIELIEKADQPFADSSLLPTYLLSKATKQYVSVALGGDGADELFLGYPNFKLLRITKLLEKTPASLGELLQRVGRFLPHTEGYMNWRFLLQQLTYGLHKPANVQSIYWMAAVPPNELDKLWTVGNNSEQLILDRISAQVFNSNNLSLSEQWQYHFLQYYLANDILQKTDRSSMYSSLEVRSPFLSSPVVESALKLPHSLLFKGGTGKLILKQLAKVYLPKSVIYKKKHGFALPVSDLLRRDLRPIVEEILLNKTNPMYQFIHYDRVNLHWQNHLSEKRDSGKTIWGLLMLAAFFKNQF